MSLSRVRHAVVVETHAPAAARHEAKSMDVRWLSE